MIEAFVGIEQEVAAGGVALKVHDKRADLIGDCCVIK
jgi:hypothetical protein